jgi:hypothetical protein
LKIENGSVRSSLLMASSNWVRIGANWSMSTWVKYSFSLSSVLK